MAQAISRMQFLCGDFTNRRPLIRPPWAIYEALFPERCNRCNACLKHCTEQILTTDRGGYPQVDFRRGECSFCQQCLEVCETGALRTEPGQAPWFLVAEIDNACLAIQGVFCSACKEQCEQQAIQFQPRVGGPPLPQLDSQLCNGCGACYKPCPAGAIRMHYPVSSATDREFQRKEMK